MKYLNKRDQFLKESKFTGLQKYEKTPYSGENFPIYESGGVASNHGAGPFSNDIGWNDSLLGRFINHLVRKAKVMIGKMRIKSLTRQLKATFQDIIDRGRIDSQDSENKSETVRVILYSFFWELVQAVDRGERVIILRRLTQSALDSLEKTSDFDEKKSLRNELESFLKFLEQFKDEDGESVEDSDEESDESEEEVSDSKGVYFQMVKNLKSLSLILSNYKNVNTGTRGDYKKTYKSVEGDTVQKIQQNPKVNIKKLDTKTIRVKNKQLSKYPKDTDLIEVGTELVLENSNLFENTIGTGAGVDRGNVKTDEDHLTQAFTKLKRDIEVLISPKEKGIGVDFNSLNELIKNSNDSKNKEYIKLLYSDIKRYLVGDKKSTLQEKDPLFKESLNISSPKERVIIAEKIARFSKRALQFKGTNLEGGLGDLKSPLLDFIKSLDIILKSEIKTDVKESNIFKYNGFISILNESTQDGKARELPTGSVSEKIKEFFDKNCKGVRSFTIDKTEALKISQNLENTKIDKFIIDGFDPIIEIIRIFNRAYKIYTTRIISKRSQGVTGGTSGPSAGTAMEYLPLGSGGGAPYRHIKTFNIWEDAVMDILGNRDYQIIFDKKTVLRVGDEERPEKGVALRKFIIDMLDGEKLYGKEEGGSSKGTQAKFLEEYFGEVGNSAKNNLESTSIEDGTSDNDELQEEINKGKTELKMSRIQGGPSIGSVFTISVSPSANEAILIKEANNDATQLTFIVTENNNGNLGLVYFESFGALEGLFKNIGNYTTLKGDFIDLKTKLVSPSGNKWKRHYTKVKSGEFDQKFKKGSKIKINHVADQNYTTFIEGGKFVINDIFWLTKKDKEGKNIPFKINEDSLERAKKWFKDQGMIWNLLSIITDKAKIEKL
jgi:hypothetical protein